MPSDMPDDLRRHLPLRRILNARDLGGYRTRDDRVVRWGRVYRSGMLALASSQDITEILSRGVRVVCDLRSGPERLADPAKWLESAGLDVWGHPDTEWAGDSGELLRRCLATVDQTRKIMTEVYGTMPFVQAGAFGEVIRRLARGEGPLLFHCSAGKDRSGGLAALVLYALGVPMDAIISDYLLSMRSHEILCRAFLANPRHAAARGDLTRPWLPMMDCDPRYLSAMFEAVCARRGSVEAYLEVDLGLGTDGIAALRHRLLE